MQDIRKKRVLVFGTFDGIHEGHRFLFSQARTFGDELIAVIARDDTVQELKHKKPRYTEIERLQAVKQQEKVTGAVLGDNQLSSYGIIEELKPGVVCFGYDQLALEQDFKKWLQETKRKQHIEIKRLLPFQPETYHSSLL